MTYFLILAACYFAAIILTNILHGTITVPVEFTPRTSHGEPGKVSVRFVIKGAGFLHGLSVLIPFLGIADRADSAAREELIDLAQTAISTWTLSQKRDYADLRRELRNIHSAHFTIVRCTLNDVNIPPEPKQPEPEPKPKSFFDQMFEEKEERLRATKRFKQEREQDEQEYADIFESPLTASTANRIFDDIEARILEGEPSTHSYRGIRAGRRNGRTL
jgi:hypothetical protein